MREGMLGSNLEGGERNVHIKTRLGEDQAEKETAGRKRRSQHRLDIEDRKTWTNEYGDKEKQEKVNKGKGTRSVRGGFLNVPKIYVEQLGIIGGKK